MENNIYEIAKKQCAGLELDAQEKAILTSFLKDEENAASYDSLSFVLQQTQPEPIDLNIDVEEEWNQFKLTQKSAKPTKIRKLSIQISGIAAAIAILFSIVLFSTQQEDVVYATNNEIQQFTLPDNSTVILNKNSSLTLLKKFNKKERATKLQGEGYFQIAKNKDKAFTIELENQLNVKVLGTSFNLRSFENEAKTDLHVIEGRVAFGFKNKKPELVVEKGNQASFNSTDSQFKSQKINNNHITTWQTGQFKFDNTPLDHLIESFEHYYNKTIVYPNSKTNLKYSGQFNQPQELDFAKILALAFGWDYEITESKIVFSEKK